MTDALQQVGCPIEAIQPQQKPSPAELLHLSTAERERIRTVPSLHIPCKQTMIHCKKQLASSHATETGTFPGGAYMADPLAYVSVLNGDWCFINAVLGLMSPSATHPCPICIVTKNSLLKTARHRNANDKHSRAAGQQPLLTIPPERIVPTPLHLFLGISNRIILDAFSELLGKERVETALKAVTTVHSAGCSGKSDLYDLNGPEISKWIKRECSATLLAAAADVPAATKASHSVLSRWL